MNFQPEPSFATFDGQVRDTRVWRSPACGSLWLDDQPVSSPGKPECGCDRCGGSVMELVGSVSAADIVALATALQEHQPTGGND